MIGCDVIRMETMTLMVFLFVGAIAIQFETYDKAIRDVETGAPGVKNSATPNGADKRCEMREETLESTNKQSSRSPDKAFDALNPIDALGIALIDFINIFSQLFYETYLSVFYTLSIVVKYFSLKRNFNLYLKNLNIVW